MGNNRTRSTREVRTHREQLKSILPELYHAKTPINASAWKKDGEDHINLSRYGLTDLGRRLDVDHPRNFDHPELGSFKSLNSLWYFLRAREPRDHIRGLSGGELKDFVFQNCGGLRGSVPNFRAVIMHSAWLRVKAFKDVVRLLEESTLPFDCYKTLPSGLRQRFEHSLWFTGGYEEIRLAVKEKREPNFDHLMEKGHEGVYDGVIKMLQATFSPISPADAPVAPKPEPKAEPKRPNRDNRSQNRQRNHPVAPAVEVPVVTEETIDSATPAPIVKTEELSVAAPMDVSFGESAEGQVFSEDGQYLCAGNVPEHTFKPGELSTIAAVLPAESYGVDPSPSTTVSIDDGVDAGGSVVVVDFKRGEAPSIVHIDELPFIPVEGTTVDQSMIPAENTSDTENTAV